MPTGFIVIAANTFFVSGMKAGDRLSQNNIDIWCENGDNLIITCPADVPISLYCNANTVIINRIYVVDDDADDTIRTTFFFEDPVSKSLKIKDKMYTLPQLNALAPVQIGDFLVAMDETIITISHPMSCPADYVFIDNSKELL
jgi:hypothetical protein